MDDGRGARQRLSQRGHVADVALDHLEQGIGGKPVPAEVQDIVDDDAVAGRKQARHQPASHVTGPAGDEDRLRGPGLPPARHAFHIRLRGRHNDGRRGHNGGSLGTNSRTPRRPDPGPGAQWRSAIGRHHLVAQACRASAGLDVRRPVPQDRPAAGSMSAHPMRMPLSATAPAARPIPDPAAATHESGRGHALWRAGRPPYTRAPFFWAVSGGVWCTSA